MTKISELLAVKIENTALRIQNLQEMGSQILVEQRRLLEEARVEVGASLEDVYSIQTQMFSSK